MEMIKTSEFIEQYKQGKVSAATLIKMAAFKDELEKGIKDGKLDGLVKQALWPWTDPSSVTTYANAAPTLLSGLGKGIGKALNTPSAHAAIGMALVGAAFATFTQILEGLEGKILDWTMDLKKPKMFEEMLEVHPDMRDLPLERVKLYFEALLHFSPSMAENPLTAGAYIKQAMKYDHVAQGPLPASIQEIGMIEKNRRTATKGSGSSYVKTIFQPLGASFGVSSGKADQG